MKNVTITLDPEVARWARIRAAERETSVSRLVGEMLRDKMLEESAYASARASFLARAPVPLGDPEQPYPRREELYDRSGLR